jgi:hypothetical protein
VPQNAMHWNPWRASSFNPSRVAVAAPFVKSTRQCGETKAILDVLLVREWTNIGFVPPVWASYLVLVAVTLLVWSALAVAGRLAFVGV